MLKAVCINESEQDRARQLRDAFSSFLSLFAPGPVRPCTLRMGKIIVCEQHKTAGNNLSPNVAITISSISYMRQPVTFIYSHE